MLRLVMVGFVNEKAMEANIRQECVDVVCPVIGGVVFSNLPSGVFYNGDTLSLPKDITYKLRIRLRSYGEVSAIYAMLPNWKPQIPRPDEQYGKYNILLLHVFTRTSW